MSREAGDEPAVFVADVVLLRGHRTEGSINRPSTPSTVFLSPKVHGGRGQKMSRFRRVFSGALGRTRTCDLLIRSQTLYPAELRARAAGL